MPQQQLRNLPARLGFYIVGEGSRDIYKIKNITGFLEDILL